MTNSDVLVRTNSVLWSLIYAAPLSLSRDGQSLVGWTPLDAARAVLEELCGE